MPRPAIPIAVHKKKGTFRKSRHGNKSESSGELLNAKPPEWFAAVIAAEMALIAKRTPKKKITQECPQAEWFRGILEGEWGRLSVVPHIRQMHAAEVQQVCVLYLRMVEDAVGLRPLAASERACLHSIYMQLGCTPASQAKVSAPEPEKLEDPWDKLG